MFVTRPSPHGPGFSRAARRSPTSLDLFFDFDPCSLELQRGCGRRTETSKFGFDERNPSFNVYHFHVDANPLYLPRSVYSDGPELSAASSHFAEVAGFKCRVQRIFVLLPAIEGLERLRDPDEHEYCGLGLRGRLTGRRASTTGNCRDSEEQRIIPGPVSRCFRHLTALALASAARVRVAHLGRQCSGWRR